MEKQKMESQKIENALNLALDATEEEREKSLDLSVGYNQESKEWEVIVKYVGDISALEQDETSVVYLLNGYAILTVQEGKLSALSEMPQIIYVEKPKRLYFQRLNSKRDAGITRIQNMEGRGLTGEGVIIGILDSGIDYMNREFRTSEGQTRILSIWDQTIEGNPPMSYRMGTEYGELEINRAIMEQINGVQRNLSSVPSQDTTGHGTAVAGIGVGENGVAPGAKIIVVKLGVPRQDGFPRTTELMQGLDYLVRKAVEYGMPMVVNISIGNMYGAHDGSSILETYMSSIANDWKVSICVGNGNEGNTAGHVSGQLVETEVKLIELAIAPRELSLNVQIWKYYEDQIEISLVTPWGEKVGPIREIRGTQRYELGDTEILLYYGEPAPYSLLQEIYIEFIPVNIYIDSGVWSIEFTPIRLVTGTFSLWLPSSGVLNIGTNFLRSTSSMTITVPATADKVISVGAYNSLTNTYADFSGRGGEETPRLVKPDIIAPGVGIRTTGVNNSEVVVSGTSFATPFVTGSAALLMEYGLVRKNDLYLYGEKMKAYIRSGGKAILGIEKYPSNKAGYGKLDLFNTFENIRRL